MISSLFDESSIHLNLDLLDTPSFPFAPSAFPAQNLQNQPNQTLHS